MANDHFVAKTYLKHFTGSSGMLHVYRKYDRKTFPSTPSDICHEWNGDIIEDFLSIPTTLGDYREIFGRHWNSSLETFEAGSFTAESKLAIAGYWANLLVCTPALQR